MKSFLDSVAYLILRGNSEGTLTNYKEMAREKSEIPVSCCADSVQALFFGEGNSDRSLGDPCEHGTPPTMGNRPSEKMKSSSEAGILAKRIDQIRNDYPGGVFSFERVNTENVFHHKGRHYRIADTLTEYQPSLFRGELLYCMDTIVVVWHDGKIHHFTQDYQPVAPEMIIEIG